MTHQDIAAPLGEMDIYLIGEGRHEQLWEALGAHCDADGTRFTVWAPNARDVRVEGDFNGWDRSSHPMERLPESGVWQLKVPGVGAGTCYRYVVQGSDGQWREKADPMANATEVPPRTGSVVHASSHEWGDEEWLASRTALTDRPMSVYEVHLASWREGRSYADLATELVDYVRETGFTHVEFLPVMEHPYGGSWGYQVTSYFAPTSRLGDPDGLRLLIDALHQAGIGVILDWVPAHFPKDEWALARFDGGPLYEDPNPTRGEHPDWGTLIFDFGRLEVRNFLVASALYWLEEFHADALRVDAVASMLYLDYSREPGRWTPNVHGGRENLEALAFLRELNATVHKRVPGAAVIAEESTAWPGVTTALEHDGLGFDFKWNMGWMHDTFGYLARDPMYRSHHHGELTFSLAYAFSEKYVLPISHDEVVHGKGSLVRKMPGDRWQQLANIRALLAYQWSHPGKQLLFMGCEFAQDNEWAESGQLDWWLLDHGEHRGVHRLVQDLNRIYAGTPALWEQDPAPGGFTWLAMDDAAMSTVAFVRWARNGDPLVAVVNFAGVPHEGYRVGLPFAGAWDEVLNTDADVYGGSGVGNLGVVTAEEVPYADQPASAVLRVPPLGALWLKPRPDAPADR
jgi:1,4-alpha-glucan branching enzyme